MFRNQHFVVKLVRDQRPQPREFSVSSPPKTDHYVALATVTTERIAKGAATLVGAYMAADTLRTVAIHIVRTKIK